MPESPQDGEITSAKTKKTNRLKDRLLSSKDIKYLGPFSYRFLRIFAWISLLVGNLGLINSFSTTIFQNNELGTVGTAIVDLFSPLAIPLFIIATFGLILNGNKSMINNLITYGGAFFGIGLGFTIFYYRYIEGVVVLAGFSVSVLDIFVGFIRDKVNVNVFADLFAFALFHFFVNYSPKKCFKGKSVVIFRLGALIPVAYIICSYVIKILSGEYGIVFPFFVYPFLATKSPFMSFMFMMVSLWIKNRERLFLKLGATKEEYQHYLLTRRSSLSFAVHLSLLIIVFAIIESLFFLIIETVYKTIGGAEFGGLEYISSVYGLRHCSSLVLAIPLIFLYSYNRVEKSPIIDMVIPIIGVSAIAALYVESVYQFIVTLLA